MDPTVGLGVSLGALRAQFKVKD